MPRHCSYCRSTQHTRPTCARRITHEIDAAAERRAERLATLTPERAAAINSLQADINEATRRLNAVIVAEQRIQQNEHDQNAKYWEFAISPSPTYEKVECECPVCYESCPAYKFNCTHSLCYGCYYKIKLTAHCSNMSHPTIKCPLCRANV